MKLKKLLAAALAAALTLAGCGTTVLSAEETKELLTLSQKTMATVESMAAEMTWKWICPWARKPRKPPQSLKF